MNRLSFFETFLCVRPTFVFDCCEARLNHETCRRVCCVDLQKTRSGRLCSLSLRTNERSQGVAYPQCIVEGGEHKKSSFKKSTLVQTAFDLEPAFGLDSQDAA